MSSASWRLCVPPLSSWCLQRVFTHRRSPGSAPAINPEVRAWHEAGGKHGVPFWVYSPVPYRLGFCR